MPGWFGRKTRGAEDESSDSVKVNFTHPARTKILELLGSRGSEPGDGALRIGVTNPGAPTPAYDMALEESGAPRSGDAVIDAGGFIVLVDAQSVDAVNGATVDFVDDLLRPGFRVDPPAPPTLGPSLPMFGSQPAAPQLDLSDELTAAVHHVIEHQVNPGIAQHGGRATLLAVRDEVVYVQLGGGCQGCSMVSVTLKQGIERLIKEAVPQIKSVVDITDHSSGANPFFQQSKGGASPFQQASKG